MFPLEDNIFALRSVVFVELIFRNKFNVVNNIVIAFIFAVNIQFSKVKTANLFVTTVEKVRHHHKYIRSEEYSELA